MKASLLFVLLFSVLSANLAHSHARMKTPAPRNDNSGIKSGPCGGLPHSSNPTVVQGGKSLTVNWEETVNHPGKFIISLSMGNDLGFQKLQEVQDTQNDGLIPHAYTTTVMLPNTTCDNCTLQLIQSMEENPNAPTFYYSCADIKIAFTGAGAPVQGQGVSTQAAAPAKMAGCGLVKNELQNPPNLKMVSLIGLILLCPLLMTLFLRGYGGTGRRLRRVRVTSGTKNNV